MKTIQIEQIRTVLILAAAAYLVASAGWYIFGSPDISQSIVDWFQLNQGSRVYSKQDNISYADASDSRRKGDVYLPASSEPERPLLVVVHGGSWNQGSKADFEERVMARYFA